MDKDIAAMIEREITGTAIILLLAGTLLSLYGCQTLLYEKLPVASSTLIDTNGTFRLDVMNYSPYIGTVDIRVEIDGELIVSEHFMFEHRHHFKQLRLAVAPGRHRLHAWTVKGGSDLSVDFDAKDGETGILSYQYGKRVPRGLKFYVCKDPEFL